MAISVPSAGAVTTKWSTRAASASGDYKTGVQNAGQSWQSGVDNAEDNWSNGVSMAAGSGAYSRGVSGMASTYVDKSVNLGATRYGPGVSAATGKFQTQIGKVLSVIGGITLPPRMATGSNDQRSQIVSSTLHQAKLNGAF